MDKRLELQGLLERVLGSQNVYFQPPENVKMKYPAIVYELDDISHLHADNVPYTRNPGFMITLIDPDPTSKYVSMTDDAKSRKSLRNRLYCRRKNAKIDSFYRIIDLFYTL